MATGTFTYNALRTETLKMRIKTQKELSFKLDRNNVVSVGTTAIKPYLSICLVGLVRFARYCGKMYSRHLFSYGGLSVPVVIYADTWLVHFARNEEKN